MAWPTRVWPAWDASGKYLWFFASTDFGLKSQWLDMTSYDHDETFGLYLAVLKKGEPSPLLPESDEDHGVGSAAGGLGPGGGGGGRGGRGGRGAAAPSDSDQAETAAAPTPTPRAPVNVQIDFDGLEQRIVAVQGVAGRQYSELRAGVAGTVYYLEAGGRGGNGGNTEGEGPGGSVLQRYRLSDRRAAPFVTGVAAYDVSADGHKLVYRAGGGGGGRGGRGAAGAGAAGPALFLVDADRAAPQAGTGRLNVSLRMYLEPKEEFKQIFYEGWRIQRDYLYVPNMHGADWPKMKEMYGQLLPYVEPPRRSQLPARHDGLRDRHRTLLRTRRRYACAAQLARRPAAAPISKSTADATRSPASMTTKAGTPTCARLWPSPA